MVSSDLSRRMMDAAVATAVKVRKTKMLQACTGRWRCSSSWWSQPHGPLYVIGIPSIANLLPRKCHSKTQEKKHQQQTKQNNKRSSSKRPNSSSTTLPSSQLTLSSVELKVCGTKKHCRQKKNGSNQQPATQNHRSSLTPEILASPTQKKSKSCWSCCQIKARS